MEKIKLSIVIINYNSGNFLENCLSSIQTNDLIYEVLVVDNNSTDFSYKCAEQRKNILLIRCKENGGYAKAANNGIKASKGEFVLIANPDIVFSAGAIENMLACFINNTEIGLVGPRIKNFDETIQYECKRNQPTLLNSLHYFLGLPNWIYRDSYINKEERHYQISEYVKAISGSCMLFRRKTLEKCGLFDEQFFMYGEDLDMCYRVIGYGYKVFYNSQAVIYHYKGGCTKNIKLAFKYKTESLIRLINKQNNYFCIQRIILSLVIKLGYRAKMLKECFLNK